MFSLNEEILREAKELAQKMLISGAVTSAIRSGFGAEIACVSTDKSQVLSLVSFKVEGGTFYLGHRL